jgi:hypothetical protein
MYPALQDKFHGLTIVGCIEAFQATRDDIETIASTKFDGGNMEQDGRIRVTTRDLIYKVDRLTRPLADYVHSLHAAVAVVRDGTVLFEDVDRASLTMRNRLCGGGTKSARRIFRRSFACVSNCMFENARTKRRTAKIGLNRRVGNLNSGGNQRRR